MFKYTAKNNLYTIKILSVFFKEIFQCLVFKTSQLKDVPLDVHNVN